MSKKKKTKKSTDIQRKYTQNEVKKMMTDEKATIDGDLGNDLRILGDKLLPKYFSKDKEEVREETDKKLLNAMTAEEFTKHIALMGSFNYMYRGLSQEFSNRLIKEYNCKTVGEKALAEIITNSYIRVLDNSTRLNNSMNAGEYITENRTKYLAMLSKQIDRANRQFLSALTTLKQLKTPSIEMNIKTNTAFVSQNQQINSKNETNETK